MIIKKNASIKAAEEDNFAEDIIDDAETGLMDNLDEMADNIEDMQDSIEDIQQDEPNIDVDNNISDHYIAECDYCHGIFISAVTETDHEVESIHGICPLCEHESEQYLNWVIKDANEDR